MSDSATDPQAEHPTSVAVVSCKIGRRGRGVGYVFADQRRTWVESKVRRGESDAVQAAFAAGFGTVVLPNGQKMKR